MDLNLLPALDALLTEGSVTGAARRLGLSASAMSRTLARLRSVTGDPLLVRAGGGLVATPRAIAMREQVREVARDARTLLSPQATEVDLAALERTFVVRGNEGFVALLAPSLVSAVVRAAPRVQLRFVSRPVKDALSLREGRVDLEIGVLGNSAPEVRIRSIFRDRFVGVARTGHPLLASPVTPATYADCQHVVQSTAPWQSSACDAGLLPSSPVSRMRCASPASRTSSRRCRGACCVPACPAPLRSQRVLPSSNFPSRRQRL